MSQEQYLYEQEWERILNGPLEFSLAVQDLDDYLCHAEMADDEVARWYPGNAGKGKRKRELAIKALLAMRSICFRVRHDRIVSEDERAIYEFLKEPISQYIMRRIHERNEATSA